MAKVVRNPELARKIKDLRGVLGCSQEEFSRRLGVTRPQITKWEKGTEAPSNEKLVALGNTADTVLREARNPPSFAEQSISAVEVWKRVQALEKLAAYPDSEWFWELAGVDLGAVRESISRKMAKGDPAAGGSVSQVPRLDIPALLRFVKRGSQNPKHFATDFIPFPALFAPVGASLISVQATDRLAGGPLFAGDLSLLRLARREGEKPGCDDLSSPRSEDLLDCLVAVFFESMPNEREPSPDAARWLSRNRRWIGPTVEYDLKTLRSGITPEPGEQAEKYLVDARGPGVLFGTLRVQSLENWDGDFDRLGRDYPWRLVLDCGDTWNGLTAWSTQAFPWDGTLRIQLNSGVHILGAVVGWLRAPGGIAKV